jgi:hypothetical protein
MSDEKPYAVGYGRPPLDTRFKKGESANPRGRPKGSRGVAAIIQRAASEKIVVTENGRRRVITKLDAAATQLLNQAASGNPKAIALAMALLERLSPQETPARDIEARRATDAAVLAGLKQRFGNGGANGA